jgi:hypothetical protein
MKRLSAILGLMALFATPGLTQEERAALTGVITDPSGAPVPGAIVEASGTATGFHRSVQTNEVGVYLLPGLQIGEYSLKVSKPGFRSEEHPAVRLAVGETRTMNAALKLAANSTEVEVVAAAEALEQTAATISGFLGLSQVEDLPVNGRAWTALMSLVPGAIDSGGGTQKSIRFSGRGVDDTNYRFDGVDATAISNQAPNTSYRLQISTEAIAEFKVDTALFNAETGGTAGGQVEVISRAGSNAFHGSAFEFLRNNVISSRGPFDPSTLPPLRLNQFGGSGGGPIVKNRTFFFAAYEGLRQVAHNTLIGNVPSDAFRAQVLAQSPVLAPILNAFPRGNQTLSANVSQYVHTGSITAAEDSGLIRVDHRISDATYFYARYNIDHVVLASPSGALLDVSNNSAAPMNATVSLSHTFSPTMYDVLQLGMNRIHALSATDGHFFDVSGLYNSVTVAGLTKLNQETNAVKSPTTYSLKDDFTWTHRTHTVKAGVEIKTVLYNYSQAPENGMIWSSLANFAANQMDQLNLIGGVPTHGLNKTMVFAYIQDAWKVQPNLTVTVGLRYEFFNRFHEIYGRDLPFDLNTCGGYCPVGSEFTFPVTNNIEPRVALDWAPKLFHDKTVIRAGFGTFKGEGQLGDLNAPSDNYTQRSSLSSATFPGLSFPPDPYYQYAGSVAVTPRGLIRNRRDPSVLQWGLQVQNSLPAGFVLTTGYMGYHAYHQFARTYVNLIDPATGQRPMSQFGPIDVKGTSENSHFHAWQTSIQRRFKGVSLTANYMWSHGINDGSTGGGEADYAQNNACRTCEVASADFDVRHVFSANSVYELPYGKGRRWGNRGGVGNAILGGWQLGSIFYARTGNPDNVIIERSASSVPDGLSVQNGSYFTRPNYVSGISSVPANQQINHWINAAAFSVPADGTWGNAGRNLVRGPHFWQLDVSMIKEFALAERVRLAVRADAFNVANRPQWGDPSGDFSSPSFGQITTTVNNGSPTGSGTPREYQFSMRLTF